MTDSHITDQSMLSQGNDPKRLISASLLRIRGKSPFFATLALFTCIYPTQQVAIAATNGQDIFLNPDYIASLPSPQLDGLILHEVLHAALLHVFRRGARAVQLWNIAADIVVNGMIDQQGVFTLPPDAVRDPQLEHLSVEEVYDCLLQKSPGYELPFLDLWEPGAADAPTSLVIASKAGTTTESSSSPSSNDEFSGTDGVVPTDKSQADLETHWRHALQQAMSVPDSSKEQGYLPAGLQRELSTVTQPQLDWRSYLWRYVVQTPTDFMGFDRRFVYRGLYLESLEGESVKVFVAVDTSGSISNEQLGTFISEVQGILRAYPHLEGELYYADAQVYGPYPLDKGYPITKPMGGGGTSFVPFLEKISQQQDWQSNAVCVYLTDGYGTFPSQEPELPVLWVVTPGGLDLNRFPFGETVRLLSHS
ncbi:MAG: VWA-like domain-containing protein [Cyanobacteria bacterium P01_F01_bin.13]